MNWTEEQVLAMAPDAASVKAGKAQAKTQKWLSLHRNDNALWGEIKGSGSKPYQTAIDTTRLAFKCSCPSRKFPCKHALGLALLFATASSSFKQNEAPEWLAQWLNKREQKAEKKPLPKTIDKESQAKRAAAREQKVKAGLEETALWLKDLIRQGLAQLPEKPHSFWQAPAARMVDAQAPGIANMIKTLAQLNYYSQDWYADLLKQLSDIYLLTQAYDRLDQFPEDLQSDVKSLIGWSSKKEELKQEAGVTDNWFVLGQETEKDERLNIKRTWLYGQQYRKFALLIDFYTAGQLPEFTWMPGGSYKASLVYYPGRQSLRALLKDQPHYLQLDRPIGSTSLSQLEQAITEAYTAFPWTRQLPFLLERVSPQMHNTSFYLVDQEDKYIPISTSSDKSYLLLAISGGQPVSISGIYQNGKLNPLGVWYEENYIVLNNG